MSAKKVTPDGKRGRLSGVGWPSSHMKSVTMSSVTISSVSGLLHIGLLSLRISDTLLCCNARCTPLFPRFVEHANNVRVDTGGRQERHGGRMEGKRQGGKETPLKEGC